MRLGVYGGTFNPPHLGHLICAQEALLQLGLDRVLLVPAAVPPHKEVPDEPGPEHRLAMCRAAVEGDPRFEVSDIELRREGTSYTVDTLEELSSIVPDSELFLILGADVAAGLPSWRRPERILELARPAFADRIGTPREEVSTALASLPGFERAQHFAMPAVELSSTAIRERAAAGESIRYLVPRAVERYIIEQQLYKQEAVH